MKTKINLNYIIKTNFTYIALFFLIIWDALKVYLSLSSPLAQTVILVPIVFLGVIDNFNKNLLKNIYSPPCSIWFIWIIYVLINTFVFTGFHHHRDQNPFVFISAIFISYLLMLFIVNKRSNINELLNVLIWAYFARLLLSFIFDYSAVKGSDIVSRFGIDFNANAVAYGALSIIILILIKKIRTKKNINLLYFLLIAFSVYTIMITASKKTFVALIIVSLGYMFISKSNDFIKNTIKYIAFSGLIVGGIIFTLYNTSIGERMLHSYTKTEQAKNPERMFDGRMAQYILGWNEFIEHPINGIGLTNFIHETGHSQPLHSEYLVQFAECGLIGISIFIIFYGYIIKKLFYYRRKYLFIKKSAEIHLLSILILFILSFGGLIYSIPMMWVLIALSIRFIKECQLSNLSDHNLQIVYHK